MRSFNKFRTIKSRTAVIYLCRARRAHLLKVLRAEEKKRIGVGAETSNYGSSHHRASFKAADRSNKPKNCQIVWPPARSRTRVFRNGASTYFSAAVVLKWLSLWPCLAQLRIFEDQEMVAFGGGRTSTDHSMLWFPQNQPSRCLYLIKMYLFHI